MFKFVIAKIEKFCLMKYATWMSRKKPQFLKIEIRAKTIRYHKIALEFGSFVTFVNVPKKLHFEPAPTLPYCTQLFIRWGLHCIARKCTTINTYIGHRFKTSPELTIQCDIPLGWAHPHSIGFFSIIVHTHMSFEAYALHHCWMCYRS